MEPPITSPSLLVRLRDGADAGAWREFEALYAELILRYARRLGLRHTDAEDVRQAVLIRLFGCVQTFRYDAAQGRFHHFLGRIVRNEALRHRARAARAEAAALDGSEESGLADTEAERAWEEEWIDHHLRLALRRLRETQEARSLAVFERLLAGESVESVAAASGMTPAAVHKVKQRIRDRLRDLVAGQIREEEEPRERASDERAR
jgi:RNA polymerase sigma factor (sigma-70 family)